MGNFLSKVFPVSRRQPLPCKRATKRKISLVLKLPLPGPLSLLCERDEVPPPPKLLRLALPSNIGTWKDPEGQQVKNSESAVATADTSATQPPFPFSLHLATPQLTATIPMLADISVRPVVSILPPQTVISPPPVAADFLIPGSCNPIWK
ncbi:PREDICTED: nuclear pore-associated protein 1-like, partial [Condylura cristata]|uniref:nuclear pore-associated protein 1-like n=1 Tax=Condylura cristata TaxID=143302 RepID=UPI00064351DE